MVKTLAKKKVKVYKHVKPEKKAPPKTFEEPAERAGDPVSALADAVPQTGFVASFGDEPTAPVPVPRPLAELAPDPENPRVITGEALLGLGNSMEDFGDLSGIVWNRATGQLVCGHQRVQALQRSGASQWTITATSGSAEIGHASIEHPITGEVFPIRIVDWSPEKQRVANLVANSPSVAGEFTEAALEQLRAMEHDAHFEALRLGELEKDLAARFAGGDEPADGETDPDDVPEPPTEPFTQPGDMWIMGDHRLLCGDSTKAEDVARVMENQRAHCVVTSPPYAVGIEYDGYEDNLGNLRSLLRQLPELWLSIVMPGGFAAVNFVDIVAGREAAETPDVCEYPMALEYWPAFRNAGWALWARRIWCKPNGRVTAPWCANSNRAACDWEYIWTWKAPGDVILGRQDGAQNGWFDTSTGEALEVGKDTHGAPMPTAVAQRMIEIHCPSGGIVHEPFAGTGTTLMAAERVRRRCLSVEQAPRYCDVIVARWEAFTGRRALLRRGDEPEREAFPRQAEEPENDVERPF